MPPSETNRQLGYPADARLLIINADDFGMSQAINAAIVHTLTDGVVGSTTLMVPGPWALPALHWLQQNPAIPFGVHLTAIGDHEQHRWRPISGGDRVPSLVDELGYFYPGDRMPEFLAQVKLADLEIEFRAQIELVRAFGLQPTHLDWHSLRIGGRTDISDLLLGLAQEYGLALRVIGRAWIERVQRLGLPTIDHDFLDSYQLDPESKPDQYIQLLRELPVGLSEWAVHPSLDTAEFRALEPTGRPVRPTDYASMISGQVRETIQQEGITLLSYRPLQALWQAR